MSVNLLVWPARPKLPECYSCGVPTHPDDLIQVTRSQRVCRSCHAHDKQRAREDDTQ